MKLEAIFLISTWRHWNLLISTIALCQFVGVNPHTIANKNYFK